HAEPTAVIPSRQARIAVVPKEGPLSERIAIPRLLARNDSRCASASSRHVSLSTTQETRMLAYFVRRTSVIALISATAMPAFAQTVVSGIVRQEHGQPLPSAAISVSGTSVGGLTASDGRYRFEIPSALGTGDSITVVARAIGFERVSR